MKVLIPTQGFFPAKTYGGPPVSILNFCNLMYPEYETYIVTSNHELYDQTRLPGINDGWQKVGRANVLYLDDKRRNEKNFLAIVDDIKPDIIYLNSFFDAVNVVPFLKIAHKKNISVILAPRGELCAGALKKKYKKIPYISLLRVRGWLKNVSYQSTSDEESDAIVKYLKVDRRNVFYLNNIPSIPKVEYQHEKKESGEGKFVFLSRIHPKKNLINALAYLEKIRGNIQFDIYGPIEDKDYWNECQKVIDKLPNNIAVKYGGLVLHDEVHRTFSRYHAFLFPTFSENYGHVIAESLIVGTPVIISDQTPWNDVSSSNCGWALPLSDNNVFSEKIQKVVDLDDYEFQEMSKSAKKYVYNKANLFQLTKQYQDAFNKALTYGKEN